MGLALMLALACSDVHAPVEPADTPGPTGAPEAPQVSNVIVSNPAGSTAGNTGNAGSIFLTGSMVVDFVYASLPPGSVPNGERIAFRSRETGAETSAVLVEGGFDPIAIAATVGDTLDVRLYLVDQTEPEESISVVPERRPPVLVRVDPPPGRRDVPLNAVLLLVFSEPIDAATLTPSPVTLLREGAPVAGALEFGDAARLTVRFTPAAPLAAGADYTLLVTQAIADEDGDPLEAPLSVEFSTGLPVDLAGQLAFVSDRDGNREIYVMNADGSGLDRLTTNNRADEAPAWSPDGSQIAFASERDFTHGLYVMAADGSNITRRTNGLLSSPAWSPSGSEIAFTLLLDGQTHIARMNNTDETVTLVTTDPGFNAEPSWSPDGRQIAFVSDWVAYDFVYDIYTINADGTDRQLRTPGFDSWPNLRYYSHPAWSPDGSMIAFVYGTIFNASDMRFKVGVMSPTGVFIKDLAWAGDIAWTDVLDPGSLAWSPDGLGIAYTFVDCDLVLRTGCSKVRSIRYVSLDGEQGSTIVANADSPAWRR